MKPKLKKGTLVWSPRHGNGVVTNPHFVRGLYAVVIFAGYAHESVVHISNLEIRKLEAR